MTLKNIHVMRASAATAGNAAANYQATVIMHAELAKAYSNFETRIKQMSDAYLVQLHAKGLEALDFEMYSWILRVRRVIRDNGSAVVRKSNAGRLANVFTRGLGAIGLLLQKNVNDIKFVSHDNAGRVWDSTALLCGYARDFAYQSLIEAQAFLINGLAEVRYPDSNHVNNGMLVETSDRTISGATKLANIRNSIFHPNSQAELVKHV
ncbi:hypothetical protein RGU72_05000 [Undibacterium sp. 5I1]|uniref:hypothetical protein n=3 Tax=Undibacterium TaxID=401469 RepID=UPI002AB3CFD9|nr:hypothetical protein [Undibacterium sp. 5I1]MDY7537611.1 hypothetical protein [Undibacterium sp. 5I1]